MEKELTIKMRGNLTDINNLCRDIGELTNDYPNIDAKFE